MDIVGEAPQNAAAAPYGGHVAHASHGHDIRVHAEDDRPDELGEAEIVAEQVHEGVENADEGHSDRDRGGGGGGHHVPMEIQDDVHTQHHQQQQQHPSQQMDGRNPSAENPNDREQQHGHQHHMQGQQHQDHINHDETAGGAAGQNEQDLGLEGYNITLRIGQGAYGTVFKAMQKASKSVVAIKEIPFGDTNVEGGVPCSVIREISLLRELEHPNVVKLLDVVQSDRSGLYIVFEFIENDLKKYMDHIQISDDPMQRKGLPPDKVKSFMKQILAGVGFCHVYRVLHRDLKPHNLLVSADGTKLKLADFGLARLSALPIGPYTSEVVTLWYRAPELLLGTTKYSSAVDVWSIGCIFAEMVTGLPLFPGRSDVDQLFKIFQKRGTPNPHTCPSLTRLPHFNPEFPQWPQRPITDFIPLESWGSAAPADLLEEILKYEPDQRIGCKAALQHPYFNGHM